MIYKLTSCKKVIAKVFADLDLREDTHRISDMIEWCGEALLKINAFQTLITKVTGRGGLPLLRVDNYQAQLPCDFHSMHFLQFSESETGSFVPMKVGSGTFNTSPEETEIDPNSDLSDSIPEVQIIKVAMQLYGWTYVQAVANLNSDPDLKSTISNLLITKRKRYTREEKIDADYYTYVITPNYIKTNIKEGYLQMSYRAIPMDSDGYPLIPDSESFFEAIYWYIVVKLTYPDWRRGLVHGSVYQHAESKWNFYSRQAYGNAMMPDLSGMKTLINTWHRLIPSLDEDHNAYNDIGSQEIVHNANSSR